MIYVGTSGYSFADWVGPFYPEGTPQSEFLAYYRQHFNTTELNFTYYRMPTERMLANIGSKVEPGFLFAVKAPREITHDREGDPGPAVRQFTTALRPLQAKGQFACVLAQFPFSFHATDAHRDYLSALRAAFDDTPVVVEFRNRAWISEDTFDHLQALELGFCCVDQPRFDSLPPPLAIATSPIAYARFHGRNYEKWWRHDEAWERYDYEYSADELSEWVPRLQELDRQPQTRLTLVYMNTHSQGQAPASANLLIDLLKTAGASVT